MTLQNFNKLSPSEQYGLISQKGKIVIDFTQGDTISYIYKVNDFLVKVTSGENGKKTIFTFSEHDNFKLSNKEI